MSDFSAFEPGFFKRDIINIPGSRDTIIVIFGNKLALSSIYLVSIRIVVLI